MLDTREPLVTVIIPNNNNGKYISHAIQSIAQQKYAGGIELLIVDDGSTDDSGKVIDEAIRKWGNKFVCVKFAKHPEKAGKLAALNTAAGFGIAGKVVVQMDADDYLAPSYLDTSVEMLYNGKENGVVLAYTSMLLMDSENMIVAYGDTLNYDFKLLKEKSFIPNYAATLSEVFMRGFPYDTSTMTGAEHLRWQTCLREEDTGAYLDSPLVFYRMHEKNSSGIGKMVRSLLENQPLQTALTLTEILDRDCNDQIKQLVKINLPELWPTYQPNSVN